MLLLLLVLFILFSQQLDGFADTIHFNVCRMIRVFFSAKGILSPIMRAVFVGAYESSIEMIVRITCGLS